MMRVACFLSEWMDRFRFVWDTKKDKEKMYKKSLKTKLRSPCKVVQTMDGEGN